jgi:hypothetical protein
MSMSTFSDLGLGLVDLGPALSVMAFRADAPGVVDAVHRGGGGADRMAAHGSPCTTRLYDR